MSVQTGDSVIAVDAEGVEHRATALSSVETVGHSFPVVWVSFEDGSWDRAPWPAESTLVVPTA